VHAVPFTPAPAFGEGKSDPAFRTKLTISADLATKARAAGMRVPRGGRRQPLTVTRTGYAELPAAGLPFVMSLKPRRGTWAHGADAHIPLDAARALAWGGSEDPRLTGGDPHLP